MNASRVYLIGSEIEKLSECKFSTNRETLSFFLYKHNALRCSIRQSAISVIEQIHNIWSRSVIPTILPRSSIRKLENLHKEWLILKKNEFRKIPVVRSTVLPLFENKLDDLFDISNKKLDDALTQRQKDFLTDQRTNRCYRISWVFEGSESNADVVLTEVDKEMGNKKNFEFWRYLYLSKKIFR